jgi:hypothetical protein
MRVIWRSYGVDLTDNKSGLAKQEAQHIPRAIAPKATYLRKENGGKLTRIIVLMIPMSIGYATEAVLPAPTIWRLIPRDLCQHGRLSKGCWDRSFDRLRRDSDIQCPTKTKPNGVHFKRKHDSIFRKEFSLLRKSATYSIDRHGALGATFNAKLVREG